ncbi:unnamed protein product [Fusarium fujikuroi]|nr:related to tol protein [Fusarium fujikuroi]VTT56109.1 unnamed protein product [Fusarium fujikuroi]
MSVCGPCHDAICDIYPKVEAIYPERETTVTYPSFDPGAGGKCWICIKHAGFLEHHYPAVYERWLKHELLVTVQADFASLEQEAQPRTRHSSSNETLPFDSRGRQNMEQAIEVTRSLQIRYLWIDSLCIMQDIACGDWEAEALKMGDVYANSFLNLPASYTAGEDENPSIFSPESWNHVLPSELVLENDKELRSNLFIDGDLWNDEVGESPLMERGWVFQERFLAPRVLHFGMRQLAGECNGGGALQMFPTGLPPRFEDNYKKDVCWPIMRPINTLSSEEFCSRWHDIVTAYSAGHLTFNTDKLIAFAGIAKIIQSLGSDEYIAGTWKSTIIADLAWWVYKANGRLPSGHQAAHRAPSWSWLSSDRQICFHPYPSAHHKQEYFVASWKLRQERQPGLRCLVQTASSSYKGLFSPSIPPSGITWKSNPLR